MKEYMQAPYLPVELSDLDIAFPAKVSHLMPKREDIPADFRFMNSRNKWNQLVSDWFFVGVKDLELKPKEGIDETRAMRHIKAVIGSFEPSHEHKEEACAFLMSQWFDDATWKKAKA
jgi:hypothetical protein